MEADVQRELELLDRRLLAVEAMPLKLVALELKVEELGSDIEGSRRECKKGIDDLQSTVKERAKERKQEQETSRQERRADRNVLLVSLFSAGGLVIAALQLLGT